MRPLALDLFCGAGGVSMGLHRAGFDVIGIDLSLQPRYPFPFIRADALRPPVRLKDFDLIWASPPCQAHTSLKAMHNARDHLDLIPKTRAMLISSGRQWIMENVPGAPMQRSAMLCGTMFGLGSGKAELRRHRVFETSFMVLTPPCSHGHGPVVGVYGGHARNRSARFSGRGTRDVWDGGHKESASKALGIDWMSLAELSQAIPPAYSEFLGRSALQTIVDRG